MEAIATSIGMSKRTIYARYADKTELFRAAVLRAIERFTVPRAALEAVVVDDLEQALKAIARLRIANVATPNAIRLQRILTAQSHRFPDLFDMAFEQGTGPAIDVLEDLFVEARARGEIVAGDSRRTAVAFLSLVVSGPARMIVSGAAMDEQEMDARIDFAVSLFLHGVRPR